MTAAGRGVLTSLDAADKALSRPILRLQLPWIAELALTIPGQWAGMPASALTLLPVLIAAVATRSRTLFYSTGAVALGIAVLWFSLLLRSGVRDGTDKLVGSPLGIIVAPFLTLGFLAWFGGEAHAAGSFACTCYYVIQLLVAIIKWATLRRRPLHCPGLDLARVRRHHPLASECAHVGKGLGRCESFPSGDAASGALFGQILLILCAPADTDAALYAACALPLSTAFGRIYFHAHHLGDCLAGAALGSVLCITEDSSLANNECFLEN